MRTRQAAPGVVWVSDRRGALGERGSASTLCVAIVAALAVLSSGVVGAAGAGVARQRAAGAADLAALAAADVASGAQPGVPCAEAKRVSAANGADLSRCALDGVVVTVTASVGYLGFDVSVEARAGPPAHP
ncbi:Rv3654c family TadE-like protein [Leifsonia sp. NPDC058292]|uniref:Rv3654c family TadE-like protein n=1 Tax=Leifsonia sp. NPDC058292 TaxID=3346428 RepID=UPI0036DE43F9